jgi:DNA polymerase-3 subunit delta
LAGVSADLKAAYLLTGSDRPKIERAIHRLRDRFGEDSTERLSAREASGEDAVAACNAMGLFASSGRLVLVDEVERWKAADAKAVAEYLASPAPETVLALVCDEIRKDSPLAKACAKAGEVLVYEVSKRELPKWVAEQFARHGVKVGSDACRALVELAGDNLQELATEIDKLSVYAGRDEVGVDEIELLVAARADVPPFVLTDAWGRRDVGAVLGACESILERSAPRSREVHALVGRLAAHVRRVRSCQQLDADGVRPRDAAAQLKMHPFAAEKAFGQARNFSTEELREAIVRLADLDLALKGGSRLPTELELQRTLVAITRSATG